MGNNDPKIIGMGTDRLEEQKRKLSPRMCQIIPMTKEGHKDNINVTVIIDWNGELHAINTTANVNVRQALTASYWSQMTAMVCAKFRQGLKDKA